MRWSPGPFLVVLGAAVLAFGAWWGIARDGGTPADSTPTRLHLDVGEILDRVPGCRRDTCRVAERRDGFEYQGAPATLIVVQAPGECGHLSPASVHLVDAGAPLWSGPRGAVCGDPVGGIEVDETGNAFLAFPTEDGATKVVVLEVGRDDVDDFGTFDDRFRAEDVGYDDLQGDGVYEIVSGRGDDRRVARWNGSDYTEGT